MCSARRTIAGRTPVEQAFYGLAFSPDGRQVYASGGENALHAHHGEDHAFIVLQGKATFTFGDGRTQVVSLHQGVMIPKGVEYKFEADEAELGRWLARVRPSAASTRRAMPTTISQS